MKLLRLQRIIHYCFVSKKVAISLNLYSITKINVQQTQTLLCISEDLLCTVPPPLIQNNTETAGTGTEQGSYQKCMQTKE